MTSEGGKIEVLIRAWDHGLGLVNNDVRQKSAREQKIENKSTDLPRVSAAPEAYLAPSPVRALSHGVPVQREAVLLDVDVVARVPGVPGVIEGAQLRLVSGNRAE